MATVDSIVEATATSDGSVGPPTASLQPLSTRPVLGIAAIFLALELAVSSRYGFHRDELYFLACAHHLGWGYVDQPPLVPGLAWLSTHVFGTSPEAIRIFPAFAGAAAVVVTALMARELGGGRRAQVLAALAAATSPQVLGACHLLSTAAFDELFWCLVCFATLRILRSPSQLGLCGSAAFGAGPRMAVHSRLWDVPGSDPYLSGLGGGDRGGCHSPDGT